jgi:hypothetical protein
MHLKTNNYTLGNKRNKYLYIWKQRLQHGEQNIKSTQKVKKKIKEKKKEEQIKICIVN